MRKNSLTFACGLFSFAFIVIVIGNVVIVT